MLSLILSTLLLFIGLGWRTLKPELAEAWKGRLHKMAWYNLLAVVLLQFWCNDLTISNLPLAAAGAMLHVIPISLCLLLAARKPELARWVLAYSTYGGGNRGVLAVLLLAPALLPDFLVLDLGIFLSLMVCYPVAARLFGSGASTSLSLSSFRPAFLSIALIAAGVVLHRATPASLHPAAAFEIAKYSLMVMVSLYLGLSLSLKIEEPARELGSMLLARCLGVTGTIAISWLLFPAESFKALLPLAALYFFLPASSLAPQLTPSKMRDWITQRVAVSSLLYIGTLSTTILAKYLFT